ncbi:MAG: HEAT repeat domain-containing protein [Planctomycetes bacterium]|nr:HEAT repeat domain-containing protein [Planctomycetota bacterium]
MGGAGNGPFAPGPLRGIGIDLGPDLNAWEFWWEINQDRFLDLRNRRRDAPPVVTGSDEFLLREGEVRSARGIPSRKRLRAEVVPALLACAADPETAEACLLALAKIGEGPGLCERLEERLADRRLAVREAAALGLGILGSAEALPPLRDLLVRDAGGRAQREASVRLQVVAALALGLVGRACETTRAEVHAILRRTVEAPGVRREIRAAAILALGIVPPPDGQTRALSLGLLQRRWEHPREDLLVRAHAPLAIARLAVGDPLAEGFVRGFRAVVGKKSTEREVRQSCILALGLLVSPASPEYASTVDVLSDALRSSESSSRGFAAIALGEIGGERARLRLERALQASRTLVRPWAALGLGVLGHGSRRSGASVETSVEALREVLRRSRAPSTVAAVSVALGLAGDQGASTLLLDATRRIAEEGPRGLVCLGLGLAGGKAPRAEMTALVRESSRQPGLLRNAAIASLLLGDPAGVPEILGLLQRSPAAADAPVLDTLGYVGDGEAIRPLVLRLLDRSLPGISRRAAATALGRIGDRRPLPWRAEIAADQNYLAFPAGLFDPTGGTGLFDSP